MIYIRAFTMHGTLEELSEMKCQVGIQLSGKKQRPAFDVTVY